MAEDCKNKIKEITNITDEDVKTFIENLKKENKIKLEDFNIYKQIKTDNKISPLIIYILEKAIDVYNKNTNEEEIIKYGFKDVGFGYYPGVTQNEIDNNKIYFNNDNSYVLFFNFNQEFIGNFWIEHQMLKEFLQINPDLSVKYSVLNLDSSESMNEKIDKIKNYKKKSKSSNKSNSNKNNQENNKANSLESDINNNILNINDNDLQNIDNEEIRNQINNKLFYRFSLGASFEYNALKYILYGIKNYILLPRIVFYPIVKYKDYEEIDSCIIIEKMKDNIKEYYRNFKSININDYKKERKEIELNENDLVFIESTFEFEKGRDILDFMVKTLKFIKLYENIGLIKNINDYKIKVLYLYNNTYELKEKYIKDIINSIDEFKKIIAKYNNDKYNEIYENLQIIYCWPTLPILNNAITYNELKNDIDNLNKRIIQINNENKERIIQLTNENNERIIQLTNENQQLKEKVDYLIKNFQNYNQNNYNNNKRYKNINLSHYYKRNYPNRNKNNYHNKNNHYYHNYNYVNNVNKKKYNINNNNYHNNYF